MAETRKHMTLLTLLVALLVGSASPPAPAHAAALGGRAVKRPNIVVVMTDDQSADLVPYMPQVRRMQREGVSFSHYFVTDSLCCPSRASMLTGRFPHDTGVLNNTAPMGGWEAFHAHGDEESTYATALHRAGYRTAYLGKYFNGYRPGSGHVPPGWSFWAGVGSGYSGFDYAMNVNGKLVRRGHRARDYLTDVLARRSAGFIDRASRTKRPFLLVVAPFAPHHPYAAAPRHRSWFPFLGAPRTPAFDAPTRNPPSWLGDRAPLTTSQLLDADRVFRLRAQSVQAVDEMLGRLRATLRARGLSRTTYVIFTSDNGLHDGEHRLTAGKMTAYDTDIRVPLTAVGPGIAPGTTADALAANVDVAPTLMRLAGLRVPASVEGRDLSPLLRGLLPADWRDAVLVEHYGPTTPLGDPDTQPERSGSPPRYDALRMADATWVEYADGETEFYDLKTDPAQLDNIAGELSPPRRAELHDTLERLKACHDAAACRRASLMR